MADPTEPHRGLAPPNDAMAAVRVVFPQTPEDFESDERVSYSKLDQKWILEEDDGSEWEFDEKQNRWIPSLDEALIEQQREAYTGNGTNESESEPPHKKRKTPAHQEDNGNGQPSKSKKSRHGAPASSERKNTAVYITSLPLDASVSEVASVFSRCGVIAEEIESGKPRIKLYTDSEGNFKGDALVIYFRSESVGLAIQMLDDTDFRLGVQGPMGKMRVTEADRSYKKQQDKPGEEEENGPEAGGGRGGKGQKKGRSKEQIKIIRKTQKLNDKLADWSDDDTAAITKTSERYDKVVVLKHMFTLEEIEDDPAAILDIKEDVREECSKLGEVTNVILMDLEPEGVVTVRYRNSEAARACERMMDGRSFAGMKVEAYIADGSEKFRKSGKRKAGTIDVDASSDEDEDFGGEGKRLESFGKFLEQQQGGDDSEGEEAD